MFSAIARVVSEPRIFGGLEDTYGEHYFVFEYNVSSTHSSFMLLLNTLISIFTCA